MRDGEVRLSQQLRPPAGGNSNSHVKSVVVSLESCGRVCGNTNLLSQLVDLLLQRLQLL